MGKKILPKTDLFTMQHNKIVSETAPEKNEDHSVK
jgi:hypothetical protein